jgi:ABC-type Zn uptake system ZnuABC Zn-binding protein ZnuA
MLKCSRSARPPSKALIEPHLKTVELSKDLQAVDVGSADFAQGNPHFWMSPEFAIQYVDTIRTTLSQLDPAGASTYQANAAAYVERLHALDDELKAVGA